MKSLKTLIPAVLFAFAIFGVAIFGIAQSDMFVKAELSPAENNVSTVQAFADASEIADAYSTLVRTDNGVAMELQTVSLSANTPYTIWWVVFNTPLGCSEACGEDDIFAEDGSVSPNPDANLSILWATSGISSAEGQGTFSAYLPENRPLGEVVLGNGLTDARNAEVHLVIRNHGAVELDKLHTQLNSFEPPSAMGGNCDICFDEQFVIHQPASLIASR